MTQENLNEEGLKILNSLLQRTETPTFRERLLHFFLDCWQKNRNFPSNDTKDLLDELIKNYSSVITLPEKSIYYRARVHDDYSNYNSEEPLDYPEAKPSKEGFNHGGRFNPPGFNYLYLTDDFQTAIYEVKPSANAYITVFRGTLKREIKIIDFSYKNSYPDLGLNPFLGALGNTTVEIKPEDKTKNYLSLLFTLPVNQNFKSVEYAPTQMISDFVKYKGFNGICYSSTFDLNRKNFVFYDSGDLVFDNGGRKVIEINGLKLNIKELTIDWKD